MRDFLLGVLATLSTEFLLVTTVLITSVVKSEKEISKELSDSKKLP